MLFLWCFGVTVVTLIDRPQSLCYRSIWWRFRIVIFFFGIFLMVDGFCQKTQTNLFLSLLVKSDGLLLTHGNTMDIYVPIESEGTR